MRLGAVGAPRHPPFPPPERKEIHDRLNYSALLLIIDRSGSMERIRNEMAGSLTTLLREQAKQPGLLTADVVTFDDRIETTHVQVDPRTLEVELEPRGMTALLDAIGVGVTEFGDRLAARPEHARPRRVIAVVATDGIENASPQWKPAAIKALLDQQRERYGWDFVFLGANQDAVTTGTHRGFVLKSSIDRRGRRGNAARRRGERVHPHQPHRRARRLHSTGPAQCLASPY